jgi:hypothetical protein
MHDGILFGLWGVGTIANGDPQLNSMCAPPISHSPSFSPMYLYRQSSLMVSKPHYLIMVAVVVHNPIGPTIAFNTEFT